MPRLSIIRLPRDHTSGTQPGQPSRRPAMVADNDLALGQFVDLVSHSAIWKESAIFVLEDDAQNGPDHVDAHRSVLLAISPFSRRGVVDSTLYTTSGVLRTMELILGLPPMSQHDAAATPMIRAFHDARRTLTPVYTFLPAQRADGSQERLERAGRRGVAAHELQRARSRAGSGAESDHLGGGPRPRIDHAAAARGRASSGRSSSTTTMTMTATDERS